MEGIKVAVLTVSDTRDEAADKSGALLKERVESSGVLQLLLGFYTSTPS